MSQSDNQDNLDTSFEGSLPVAGKLKLKFKDIEALVSRLGRHMSTDGIFIPTNNIKPTGTLIAIELSLIDGRIAFAAEGEVIWNRREAGSEGPTGMAMRFINVSDKGRGFIEKMVSINESSHIKPAVVVEKQAKKQSSGASSSKKALDKASRGAGPVIGIDFGTCNSCVAYMNGSTPSLVPGEQGSLVIPSVVAVNDKGKLVIGVPAKEQILLNPKNTVFGLKRFLGRNFHSPYVRENAVRFPYDLTPDDENEINVVFGGEPKHLIEVATMIFEYLREISEGQLHTEVHNAIVTVPAHFTEQQRAAVRKAAEDAGLHVDLLLNEPTAAALAYGYDKDYERRILVFDLGGGTFDVSVLEVNANVFEVKGTGGDSFLGGMDFDQRLADLIRERFEKSEKVDLSDQVVALQRIRNAAENAKIQLSFEEETNVDLPYLLEKKGKPIDLKLTITREELEEITNDLVEKTIKICGATVHSMGVMPSDIDDVLLVGGQTRMPLIQKRVEEYFQRAPSKGVHPDEAVAIGAAVLAGSFKRIDGPMLFDVLSLPIGFSDEGGSFKEVFSRDASLPCRKTMQLNQLTLSPEESELHVYQGEHAEVTSNEYLGSLKMLFPTLPNVPEEIGIEFEINREGILKIHAKHEGTGKAEVLSMNLMDAPPMPPPELQAPPEASGSDEKQGSGIFKKFFS